MATAMYVTRANFLFYLALIESYDYNDDDFTEI